MTVTVVLKPPLHTAPPAVTEALLLRAVGAQVRVVTSECDRATRELLLGSGVAEVAEVGPRCGPRSLVGKLSAWRRFRAAGWRAIGPPSGVDLLWVASGDTALALGRELGRYAYVLKLRELYDATPLYRLGLRGFARGARAVVVPEECRAAIFRVWYRLGNTPVVLPNKPYYHPRTSNMKLPSEAAGLRGLDHSARIVLYQGLLGPDRDVRPVARAVAKLGPPWVFAVMGRDCEFRTALRREYPGTVHIPFIPPPLHLRVTSHSYIGVTMYAFDILNNMFCAPNKVWEHAGFGIPTLCSAQPSLRYLVERHDAGLCFDSSDPDVIADALHSLDEGYDTFSVGATRLFDSCDQVAIMASVLQRCGLRD